MGHREEKSGWSNKGDYVYLVMIVLLAVALSIYHPLFAIPGILFSGFAGWRIYTRNRHVEEELKKQVLELTQDFDTIAQHGVFSMPFPLVMIGENGRIAWYNTPFGKLFEGGNTLQNAEVAKVLPKVDVKKLFAEPTEAFEMELDSEVFLLYSSVVDVERTESGRSKLLMLYFINHTSSSKLARDYEDEKTVSVLVYIDNYDDIRSSTPDIQRPLLMAEIDKTVQSYFRKGEGLVRKYENDKYIVVLQKWAFREMESRKFDLLDMVRELEQGNTIPITLSIGVSVDAENLWESYKNARAAIDVALGRGGDQAVVENQGQFSFYGGKSKAVEKRNKVKSRVIAYALKQLIESSDSVFAMGHTNPDMDAFGAAVGVMRAAKDFSKPSYIITYGENPSITNIFEKMRREETEMMKMLIHPEKTESLITDNSLLVVVDNHRPDYTEYPPILDKFKRVVVIDHHRRGSEFIKNPVLTYLEPYASSTCELVTEVLSYMNDKTNLTKFEAEALLAGITVDTKSFSFQTGVRTFEAAAMLKRAGADTTEVRQLFRDDYKTFVHKAQVVESSKIVKDCIAIGRLTMQSDQSILIAAQSANELMNINGIDASFVIADLGNRKHISGRSIGNISVQLIVEKLGGGGHLTSAGAQLDNVSMDQAEAMLMQAIEEYFKEGKKE